MLWRFSFATTSSLDTLLSRETPPTLEEVMDEQDVLAECKAQNNKLVSYLSKEDSIKSLLQWVVSGLDELDQQAAQADTDFIDQIIAAPELYPSYNLSVPGPGPGSPPLEPARIAEDPEVFSGLGHGLETQPTDENRSRYPQVATEILTSELWTIPETILQHKDVLLRPFWDAVLPEITESPADQSERDRARDDFWSDEDEERDRKREVIRGMWVRVNGALITKRTTEMIRFIQSIPNVVERLVARIASPAVQDMIIRIVSAEEAGVPGVIEWLSSERLIPRLLAFLSPFHPPSAHVIAAELLKSIVTLCAPSPFNPQGGNVEQQAGGAGTRDNRLVRELVSEESVSTLIGFMLDPIDLSDSDFEPSSPSDPFVVHALPSVASASSSLVHICSIITELIRRNNSDFSEPHLFHTLRNRLMSIRMQPGPLDDEEEMKQLEDNMNELSGKMGIVHLGTLLTLLSDRFDRLHSLLLHPRTRSPGLTMERFRIIELYAELLHSSNMSILNRVPGRGPEYTADGILSGGLSGLEALGEAIDGDRVGENDEAQVTEARELPVSSGSTDASFTSDVTSEDEKMLEDIDEETPSASPAASGTLHPPPPSQADAERLRDVMEAPPGTSDASVSHAAVAATTAAQSIASDPETQSAEPPRDEDVLASGDKFKQMYIQHRVLPTVVDLFFEYPNNDFLHHVVYDLFQQILNGRLGPGLNRELVIELIREARLIERVLDAQRLNERVTSSGKPRLAFMGHLILIAEELVKFLSRCPPDLVAVIQDSWTQSEWDAFVEGTLQETKARDARPLAGGKPMPANAAESDTGNSFRSEDESDEEEAESKFGEPLTRTVAQDGFADRRSFDSEGDEEGNTVDRYWRTVGAEASRRQVDSSDEDDDDADWLRPSLSSVNRSDEEDEFGAFHVTGQRGSDDFGDDDGWGVFTSASQSDNDPDNPFGDDNFAPSVPPMPADPLTPRDWASQFDREFAENEPLGWSAEEEAGPSEREGVPAIVMPSLDEGDVTSTPGSTWSFTGEDDGEDLPPTTSPTFGEVEVMKRDEAGLEEAMASMDVQPELSSTPPTRSTAAPLASSPPGPIPIRSHTVQSFDIPGPSRVQVTPGETISPPDPSLIAAATEEEPLGPGVTRDTEVTPAGTLRKEVDGEVVEVPADEVALGVEEAVRERSSEG